MVKHEAKCCFDQQHVSTFFILVTPFAPLQTWTIFKNDRLRSYCIDGLMSMDLSLDPGWCFKIVEQHVVDVANS